MNLRRILPNKCLLVALISAFLLIFYWYLWRANMRKQAQISARRIQFDLEQAQAIRQRWATHTESELGNA